MLRAAGATRSSTRSEPAVTQRYSWSSSRERTGSVVLLPSSVCVRTCRTRGGSWRRSSREAHQTAQLSHPNVVSVLDFNRDLQGRPYLVMEYVDGVDLDALVGTGPLPHAVAIFIVRELLAGLGYIHQSRGRGRYRAAGRAARTPRGRRRRGRGRHGGRRR
ncbi:MAG TPA: hypothetical protein VNO30_00940 [Kofleriaceae bacterium]|nr:hypothetical protein [Kofleriaceae bacterium]